MMSLQGALIMIPESQFGPGENQEPIIMSCMIQVVSKASQNKCEFKRII